MMCYIGLGVGSSLERALSCSVGLVLVPSPALMALVGHSSYLTYKLINFPTLLTSTLKMEAACSSVRFMYSQKTTQRNNPEDHCLSVFNREQPSSCQVTYRTASV
jgi:hypothetical protein